jgi:hypothetical protein
MQHVLLRSENDVAVGEPLGQGVLPMPWPMAKAGFDSRLDD